MTPYGRLSAGLSLVEVLVAAALLALVLVPLIDVLLGSHRINAASVNEIVGTNLASELVDSITNGDDWFLQSALALCRGGWMDVLTLPAGRDRTRFLLNQVPANVTQVAFRLQPVSVLSTTRPAYSLRVRVSWREGPRELTLWFGRYFVGREPA